MQFTISTLVKRLQEIQEKDGDLPVMVTGSNYETPDIALLVEHDTNGTDGTNGTPIYITIQDKDVPTCYFCGETILELEDVVAHDAIALCQDCIAEGMTVED